MATGACFAHSEMNSKCLGVGDLSAAAESLLVPKLHPAPGPGACPADGRVGYSQVIALRAFSAVGSVLASASLPSHYVISLASSPGGALVGPETHAWRRLPVSLA